jgi:hypothetical protein
LVQAAPIAGASVTILRAAISRGDLMASKPKGCRDYRVKRTDLALWMQTPGTDGAGAEIDEAAIERIAASLMNDRSPRRRR